MQADINGTRIEYERYGSGNPVLLLHGWGASIAAMKPIASCMEQLGYEAIAIDFPGFGSSPEPNMPWGVREYADCVRAFIDKLGIRGCDVICHSFGGRVVIMLASEDPGLFGRLVLVDAAGVRSKRGAKYYLKTWSFKAAKALSRIGFIDRIFGISEKQREAGSADYKALKSDIMRKTLVNVVNLDLSGSLSSISNETLIVWGENDDVTPMWKAKLMNERIKNSGLAVIKNGGHFSYADNLPQFSAIMKAFFGKRE